MNRNMGGPNVFFEPTNIYYVDPLDASVDSRRARDVTLTDDTLSIEDYLTRPFFVDGTHRHDLALFAGILDDNGVSYEGFVVLNSNNRRSLVMAPDGRGGLPDEYITPELAKKIATVEPEEIAQFGLELVIQAARRKYPTMRGFAR